MAGFSVMGTQLIEVDKEITFAIQEHLSQLIDVKWEKSQEFGCKKSPDSGFTLVASRGSASVTMHIVRGDLENPIGPYDGKCWIMLDVPLSISRRHKRLRDEIIRHVKMLINC